MHLELFEIWVKSDASIVLLLRVWSNLRLLFRTHIVFEHLTVTLVGFRVSCFNHEFCTEDICKLCTKTISSSCHFFLLVIIIRGSQQLSKDHFWDIAILILVHLDRNSLSIVPD